ncbi:ribonuclease HI [Riemerella columbipharyngis]|uniref:ribonuclease H n=1 Tax=Riemerella columbipharyngis TaxID=1071918 RepID=A0A1G7CJA2_9FLAO|nr:ribonuclease HI [Riemerella columbipharyngis]SDE39438.1 ribonuclease HI [Riemerella columbipharyngis]
MRIEIYTDGACSGNPGRGGYGILMKISGTNYQKTFSKGFRKTTNNRMELLAVITALELLKVNAENEVCIYTDSKYVSDAINKKWLQSWIKKGFVKVKNPDLWRRIVPLLKVHRPNFFWVKGHAGHPENEICDRLAVAAASSKHLEIDAYFENPDDVGLFLSE